MRFCFSQASLIDSQPKYFAIRSPNLTLAVSLTLIVLSASQSLLLYKENCSSIFRTCYRVSCCPLSPFQMFLCGTLNFSIFKGVVCWCLRTFTDYLDFLTILPFIKKSDAQSQMPKWFLSLFSWVLFIVCFWSQSLQVPSSFQGFLRIWQFMTGFGYMILN